MLIFDAKDIGLNQDFNLGDIPFDPFDFMFEEKDDYGFKKIESKEKCPTFDDLLDSNEANALDTSFEWMKCEKKITRQSGNQTLFDMNKNNGSMKTIEKNEEEKTAKTSKRKKRSIEESKILHTTIERRRTQRINDLIKQIHEEIDKDDHNYKNFSSKKDKASILANCLSYIDTLNTNISDLKRENYLLALQMQTNRE